MDTSFGEHGDTEFPLWSHTTVGVQPILERCCEKSKIQQRRFRANLRKRT